MNDLELQFSMINGKKIIARRFFLKTLNDAHNELIKAGIGYRNKLGFVLSSDITGSWRSLTQQKQLVEKGASKTLASNHRRGSAVDCIPDWDYIHEIEPIMRKYGLDNDLRPWDGGHFNWKSNKEAQAFQIINELPGFIKEFSPMEYDNFLIQETEESGTFALVYGGKKHIVTKNRKADATLTVLMRGMQTAALNKKTWDSISSGDDF